MWAETRPHEVGITSNRRSARYGEYVPWPCTHRPSHVGSSLLSKIKKITVNFGFVRIFFLRQRIATEMKS